MNRDVQPTPRRTRRPWLVVATLILLGFLGCAGPAGPERTHFTSARTYNHPLFESQEECDAHQPPDFHINCFQWMHFTEAGEVEVVVTDILNPGSYSIRGELVSLSMEPTPELPAEIMLRLSPDGQRLTDVATGKVWTLEERPDS